MSAESFTSQISTFLRPPTSEKAQQFQHVITLLVAAKLAASAYKIGPNGIVKKLVGGFLSVARAVPGLDAMVAAEEAKALADIEADLLGDGDPDAVTELPEQGVAAAEIKEKLTALMAKEKGEHFLRKWGGIYKESGTCALVLPLPWPACESACCSCTL